ncbi:saccharopine dehydrogenase [Hoeflea poritis]|uniref:Saccharopine dehydrogenase [NAD(+), L-lysine-forming] n=1 Tax=Hoeflea poritis TaxID=2993659 RepID=A0ABT4VQR9_9HYPH|nr:saccharopine dehydrogenase [Hoeflea poritis]MDA4847054.1 saccharopine dehydrogenase [Hoeflea poritis]
MHLHLRDEARASERRTPITPSDAEGLVRSGWSISVEQSTKRIFADSDYRHAGCEIVAAGSWVSATPETIILGLKELPPKPPALANPMIHFAHIFKDQFGWRDEIERFRRGGGTLYDIEFLVDSQGRRAAAFGYWAGWMGAALALWRHLVREQGRAEPALPLQSFAGRDAVVAEIEKLAAVTDALPRCLVVGAKGRSGTGATDALKSIGCVVTEWDMEETADLDRACLLSHELLVNCVLMTGPGLLLLNRSNLDKPGTAIATISDVSCDPLSDYNPLPVYDAPTSLDRPFIEIGHNGLGRTVELTAIDNLPSLVPLEASEDFSSQFAPVLKRFDDGEEWQAAKSVFEEKLRLAAE